ncbi:MAG: amino acid ABC transporter substrate-binding protein [Candidatus Epulonipiscium fishelsonii]|nr:MAG: amino acid ABC transporter substrate-binding protein [Epulopiscium sp. AS2M-Bin002]
MKSIKLILSLVTASMLVACGTSPSEIESVETQGTLKETFIVGFDAEYPPYGYMDENGEYIGFDLEMAEIVCNNLGYELIKQPIDWASKDMELNSGNIDCIWNGFSMTPERMDDYAWSDAYIDNLQVIVVPEDSEIKELKDLAGKNVIVQSASAASEVLNSEELSYLTTTFSDLSENPDYNTAFMNLDAGATDAIAIDIGVANYQLSNRNNNYRILEEELQSELYGIGFRIEDTQLRDTIQAELMKLVEDGTYYKLGEKYGIDKSMLCLGN